MPSQHAKSRGDDCTIPNTPCRYFLLMLYNVVERITNSGLCIALWITEQNKGYRWLFGKIHTIYMLLYRIKRWLAAIFSSVGVQKSVFETRNKNKKSNIWPDDMSYLIFFVFVVSLKMRWTFLLVDSFRKWNSKQQ